MSDKHPVSLLLSTILGSHRGHGAPERSAASPLVSGERSLGVVTFLNHETTTFEVLDVAVGLDRRAAENLIRARPFQTIDQVGAVPWVGAAALRKIQDYAQTKGWLSSGDPTA